MLSTRDTIRHKDTNRVNIRDRKNIYYANSKTRKAGVTMLM